MSTLICANSFILFCVFCNCLLADPYNPASASKILDGKTFHGTAHWSSEFDIDASAVPMRLKFLKGTLSPADCGNEGKDVSTPYFIKSTGNKIMFSTNHRGENGNYSYWVGTVTKTGTITAECSFRPSESYPATLHFEGLIDKSN